MLSGNVDGVSYGIWRKSLPGDCRLQCERCSMNKFNAVSLCVNYSCESSTCFSKETWFFRLCNVKDVQFWAIFRHSGKVLCRQYVDSHFFMDNVFDISTVSQGDTHLGYSQGLEQSVILFHLRTLEQF